MKRLVAMLAVSLALAGCLAPSLEPVGDASAAAVPRDAGADLSWDLPPGDFHVLLRILNPDQEKFTVVAPFEPGDEEAFVAVMGYEGTDDGYDWKISAVATMDAGGHAGLELDDADWLIAVVGHVSRPTVLALELKSEGATPAVEALSAGTASVAAYRLHPGEGETEAFALNVTHKTPPPPADGVQTGRVAVASAHGQGLSFVWAYAMVHAEAGVGTSEMTWARYGKTSSDSTAIASPAKIAMAVNTERGEGPSSFQLEYDALAVDAYTFYAHLVVPLADAPDLDIVPMDDLRLPVPLETRGDGGSCVRAAVDASCV